MSELMADWQTRPLGDLVMDKRSVIQNSYASSS